MRCKNARERMNSIEVDRTRVKPVVKITGEFWAQTHRRRRQLPHVRVPGARRRAGAGGADRDMGGLSDVSGEGARDREVAGESSAPESEVV